MAFCKNCGTPLPDGATFCSSCGTPVQNTNSNPVEPQQYAAQDYSAPNDTNTTTTGSDFSPADVEANKAMGVLSYLGILVLIPLFTSAKTSEYTKFHVTQGFTLFVLLVAYTIVAAIINGIFSFAMLGVAMAVSSVLSLGNVAFIILAILGIINAVGGEKKELPVIGKIDIIGRFI